MALEGDDVTEVNAVRVRNGVLRVTVGGERPVDFEHQLSKNVLRRWLFLQTCGHSWFNEGGTLEQLVEDIQDLEVMANELVWAFGFDAIATRNNREFYKRASVCLTPEGFKTCLVELQNLLGIEAVDRAVRAAASYDGQGVTRILGRSFRILRRRENRDENPLVDDVVMP